MQLVLATAIVAALAYRAIVMNQKLMYETESDDRVKKYRKPNVSQQRKMHSIKGRPKERSAFGLPSWDVRFGDGTTQIVYSNDFPSNYVKDYS